MLRALVERGERRVAVCSSAPEGLFRGVLGDRLEYRHLECDVGLAQHDALTIDEGGTLARWREHQRDAEARLAAEVAWLRGRGVRLVLGDIPPLAFAAASRAGIPGVGLANFSWDWVYRHLAARVPGLEEAARAAAESYSRADLLLRLPWSGDLGVFPRVEDLPLLARRPRVAPPEVRRRLGLDGRPLVVVSLGGVAGPAIDPRGLAVLGRFQFVVPARAEAGENLHELGAERLAVAGLGYADLVGAAEAVVSKPGYGIVSDCIGAGTRLVYTDRGDFPEYPILVREMTRHLRAAYVTNAALLRGELGAALDDVLAASNPPPPDTSGARRAAERVLELAG